MVKNVPSEPPIWLEPTHVINFVVAMAGEAYDAHQQEVQNGNRGFGESMRRRYLLRLGPLVLAIFVAPPVMRADGLNGTTAGGTTVPGIGVDDTNTVTTINASF